MKVVQELVAYFDKGGKLSSRQLRKMLDTNFVASDAPSSMHTLSETVGTVQYYRITGTTEGQIWGTDTYTRDSTLGAAAVHMGLLKPGKTAVLRLTVVKARESYPGTERNGVSTSDYGPYPHAWELSSI